MADAPKLVGTDSLRTAYPKINNIIDKVNGYQSQIDQLVVDGDSSVEAAQARVNADGNSFATLKERLDNSDMKLDSLIVNVLDFGADPTGINDSLQAFKDGLALLTANGGGVLFVPSGEFYLSNSFNIDKDNIELRGNGNSTHIFGPTITTSLGGVLSIIGSSDTQRAKNSSIRNMKVSSNATIDNPVGLSKANDCLIENIYVPKSLWKGITAQESCNNIIFRNLKVENCTKYGIGFENGGNFGMNNFTIENCESNNNGEYGFYFSGSGYETAVGMSISNIRAKNNTLEGVSLSTIRDGVLTGVTLDGNKTDGISLFSCKNIDVYGVIAKNNTTNGLNVKGTGSDITIYGGKYKSNGNYGILAVSQTNLRVVTPKYEGNTSGTLSIDGATGTTFSAVSDPYNIEKSFSSSDLAIANSNYTVSLEETITLDYARSVSVSATQIFQQGTTAGYFASMLQINNINYAVDYETSVAANGTIVHNLTSSVKLNKGANTIRLVFVSGSSGGTIKKDLVLGGSSRGKTGLNIQVI